jgi:hypothetical protein
MDHIDNHDPLSDHADGGDDDNDEGTPDHIPGSHHHHGDSASSLLAATSGSVPIIGLTVGRHDIEQEEAIVDRLVPGPERPPKASAISV